MHDIKIQRRGFPVDKEGNELSFAQAALFGLLDALCEAESGAYPSGDYCAQIRSTFGEYHDGDSTTVIAYTMFYWALEISATHDITLDQTLDIVLAVARRMKIVSPTTRVHLAALVGEERLVLFVEQYYPDCVAQIREMFALYHKLQ